MATMYSAGAMMAMMAFLILAVGGPLLAVRVLRRAPTQRRSPATVSECAGQTRGCLRPRRRAAPVLERAATRPTANSARTYSTTRRAAL